jgi:hypothetical protein
MTLAIDTVSVSDHERLIAPGILIPGAREPGMLTSFGSSAADVLLPDGPSTMDAATIAERQREGGGAPSQRRSVEERSWKGLVRRLREPLVTLPVLSGWRFRTNPA